MASPSRPRHSRKVLAQSPERSRTLPSWIYRDAGLLEREREAIFGRGWSFIAHASQIDGKCGVAWGWIDDWLVCLWRDGDGAPRAGRLTCPACTASKQVAAPCARHTGCFPFQGARPHDSNGALLQPVRVEVVAGLVFANLDPDASGLDATAPGFATTLRKHLPRVEELVLCHETRHEIASNWKVMIENSLECYHCETCHPGFAGSVDMAGYRSVSDGILTMHSAREHDGNALFRYWYLWPLTEIDATPGERPELSIFTRRTLGPERFAMIGHYYRLPGDLPDAEDIAQMESNATLREDIAICESVQRGLASRGYGRGRFIVDPKRSHISEHSVHHFQLMVGDALGLR